MKFEMDADAFKRGMERITTITEKKSVLFNKVVLEVKADGTVAFSAYGYVGENNRYLTVYEKACAVMSTGKIVLTVEQMETISRMKKSIISFHTEIENEIAARLIVNNGKKMITTVVSTDAELFDIPKGDITDTIGIFETGWYLSTCRNVASFTIDKKDGNKLMQMVHFKENGSDFWLEAVDGHRLVRKTMENGLHGCEVDSTPKEALLSVNFLESLKKLVNKKEETFFKIVRVDADGTNYICYYNDEFSYMEREQEGVWFKFDYLMNFEADFKFKMETENALEIFKNAVKDVKETKSPIVFFEKYGKIYTVYKAMDFVTSDYIADTEDFGKGFADATGNSAAYDPYFMMDTMKIAKSEYRDEVEIFGTERNKPLYIHIGDSGDEYMCCILAVGIPKMENKKDWNEYYFWIDKAIESV